MDDFDSRLFDFLHGREGYRSSVYKDINGNPTGGYGFNFNDPTNQSLFKTLLGRNDINDVMAGKAQVSQDEWRKLYDATANNAKAWVDQSFPGVQLNDNQRLALTSLAYNNPALLGPKLRAAVHAGDWQAAANEIRNNSNRTGDPGIQNRRNLEADTFLGLAPSQGVKKIR